METIRHLVGRIKELEAALRPNDEIDMKKNIRCKNHEWI